MVDVLEQEMQLADYTASLYKERFLNDQYKQLHQLQDESNPEFVSEVVSLFFKDSERLLTEMNNVLNQQNKVDFKMLDAHVHQFKGSSSSIGAQRVQNVCIPFKEYCDVQDIQGCLFCLQLIRDEYLILKSKLETLFKMEKQVLASRGSIPMEKQVLASGVSIPNQKD